MHETNRYPRPFGKYLLLRQLAVGGMAEVYLARVSGPIPGPGWSWQILSHSSEPLAADRWCQAAPAALPTSGAPLRVAGDRLWWISLDGQPASLALADLRCVD